MNPDPIIKPIRLKPLAKKRFKEDLYWNRANCHCETCSRYVPLLDDGEFNVFTCAHLSHIKSYGAGGGDTPENCLIECPDCHLKKKHGPRWSQKGSIDLIGFVNDFFGL